MCLTCLRSILVRVRLAEREMMLLPEVFSVTAELHLAAGDLASLIAEASDPTNVEATVCRRKSRNVNECSLGSCERVAAHRAFQ